MAKLLQLRRGNTEQHIGSTAAGTGGSIQPFVGEQGEVTVNTTDFTLHVHDGPSASGGGGTGGGHKVLSETNARTFGFVHPVAHSNASLTIDLSDGSNQKITFSTNAITTINVTGATDGQSGSIFFVHNVAGGLSGFNNKFEFAGGITAPASSLTSGSVDRLDYIVYVDTAGSEKLHCVFSVGVT